MKRYIIRTFAILLLTVSVAPVDTARAESASRKAVREYVEANMPWPLGSARIDFLSEEKESVLQSREIVLRVEPAGSQDYIGDMVFLVKSFKDGHLVKTESVRARIEVLRDVIVAAKELRAGTILSEDDLHSVSRWVRRIPQNTIDSIELATGKRISSQVSAGREILGTILKDAPLVRKGKMVKIVFDSGLMQIATVGMSEEDGVAGNIIRVKNITSNKTIYARVISESLVGIEF